MIRNSSCHKYEFFPSSEVAGQWDSSAPHFSALFLLFCWLLAARKQSLSQFLPFVRVKFSVCFWRCTWEYRCGSHGSHPKGSQMLGGLQEPLLCEGGARGSSTSPPPSPSGHPRAERWAQGPLCTPQGIARRLQKCPWSHLTWAFPPGSVPPWGPGGPPALGAAADPWRKRHQAAI